MLELNKAIYQAVLLKFNYRAVQKSNVLLQVNDSKTLHVFVHFYVSITMLLVILCFLTSLNIFY